MNAFEAKKLVEKVKAEKSIGLIYDIIKGVALLGKEEVLIKDLKLINENHVEILKDRGYIVKAEYEETSPAPYERNVKVGYLISWK